MIARGRQLFVHSFVLLEEHRRRGSPAPSCRELTRKMEAKPGLEPGYEALHGSRVSIPPLGRPLFYRRAAANCNCEPGVRLKPGFPKTADENGGGPRGRQVDCRLSAIVAFFPQASRREILRRLLGDNAAKYLILLAIRAEVLRVNVTQHLPCQTTFSSHLYVCTGRNSPSLAANSCLTCTNLTLQLNEITAALSMAA
jgi:hypothetical protein